MVFYISLFCHSLQGPRPKIKREGDREREIPRGEEGNETAEINTLADLFTNGRGSTLLLLVALFTPQLDRHVQVLAL